jgi:uncharacterized protein involved in exopolysaccharide biosynthesis
LLVGPFAAALLGTAGYVVLQPAAYQSTANVWVNGAGAGTQSAAQTQSDLINQFLKTDSFADSVAQSSPLGGYLNAHPRDAVQGFSLRSLIPGRSAPKPSTDAIRLYLASHVSVTQVGPSELTVTVTGPTPDVAKGTADALISQLTTQEVSVRTAPTQTQLALDQTQLQDQTAVLTNDLAAVRAYLVAHPNLANDARLASTDAQLQTLQARVAVDEQNYSQLLGKIQQAQSDLALANSPKMAPFRVVDAPQTPSSQSLFGKQQLIALAAGLLIGVIAVAAMGALLVRLDTTIHTSEEVEPMVGLRVIGSTPFSVEA